MDVYYYIILKCHMSATKGSSQVRYVYYVASPASITTTTFSLFLFYHLTFQTLWVRLGPLKEKLLGLLEQYIIQAESPSTRPMINSVKLCHRMLYNPPRLRTYLNVTIRHKFFIASYQNKHNFKKCHIFFTISSGA